MKLEFKIPGEPCAQGRPRFSVIRGHAVAFDPAKSKNYKSFVKMLAMAAMDEQEWRYNEFPLRLRIQVFQSIPKSKSKKFREAALNGLEYPTVKPDVDNVAKTIMDALSGVVYKDDKQIIQLDITKNYADQEPHVIVGIQVY